jgi:hypothetical protein
MVVMYFSAVGYYFSEPLVVVMYFQHVTWKNKKVSTLLLVVMTMRVWSFETWFLLV